MLVAAALAALAVAASACSGDDQAAGPATSTSTAAETDPSEAASLADCAAVADDDEARDCYAEALLALMRDADDPTAALGDIAVAAYTDPSGRLSATATG